MGSNERLDVARRGRREWRLDDQRNKVGSWFVPVLSIMQVHHLEVTQSIVHDRHRHDLPPGKSRRESDSRRLISEPPWPSPPRERVVSEKHRFQKRQDAIKSARFAMKFL